MEPWLSKMEVSRQVWYSKCHLRCPAIRTPISNYTYNSSPLSNLSAHLSMSPPPYPTFQRFRAERFVVRERGRAKILASRVRSWGASLHGSVTHGIGISVASVTSTDEAPSEIVNFHAHLRQFLAPTFSCCLQKTAMLVWRREFLRSVWKMTFVNLKTFPIL